MYWVSCCMREDLRHRARGAGSSSVARGAACGARRARRLRAPRRRAARRLPERHEPHARRDEVRDEGVQVERERGRLRGRPCARHAAPTATGRTGAMPASASQRADVRELLVRPGVSDRAEEGAAPGTRASSASSALAGAPARAPPPRQIAARCRAAPKRAREAAPPRRRPLPKRSSSPSHAASDASSLHEPRLDGALEPVRVRERADRERRREPRGEPRRLRGAELSAHARARAVPVRVRRVVSVTAVLRVGAALRLEGRLDLAHRRAEPAQHARDHVIGPDADRVGRSSAGTWRLPMCHASRSRRCGSSHVTSSSGSCGRAHRDPCAATRCGGRRPPRAPRPSAGRAAAPRPSRWRGAGGGGAGDRSRA